MGDGGNWGGGGWGVGWVHVVISRSSFGQQAVFFSNEPALSGADLINKAN